MKRGKQPIEARGQKRRPPRRAGVLVREAFCGHDQRVEAGTRVRGSEVGEREEIFWIKSLVELWSTCRERMRQTLNLLPGGQGRMFRTLRTRCNQVVFLFNFQGGNGGVRF